MEHKNDRQLAAETPAENAARTENARLEQRRALVKALSITGPIAVALSLSKPAWASS